MEELPSKRFKPCPYSYCNPHLKRRHDEDEDEDEYHKKIKIISNAGIMAIRRANVLQVLTDLGILTVNRRPTPQEIVYAFNVYIQRYPYDRYITQEEFLSYCNYIKYFKRWKTQKTCLLF